MQKFFLLSILVAAVACGKSDSTSDGCSSGDGCGAAACGSDDAAGHEVVLNVTGMT